MKTVYARVKSSGNETDEAGKKMPARLVDIAEYPEFEPNELDQAIAHFGGGDAGKAKIIALINTQHGTNVKNELRSRYNTPMSEGKLQDMAKEAMLELPNDPLDVCKSLGLPDKELKQFAGNPTARNEWFAKWIELYKKNARSGLTQNAGQVEAREKELVAQGLLEP